MRKLIVSRERELNGAGVPFYICVDGKTIGKVENGSTEMFSMDDYITLSKYAKNNEVDYYALLSDVKKGIYNTAVKSGLHWYIDASEKCKTQKKNEGFEDFLTVGEFAKLHNTSRKSIAEDVRAGVYETAVTHSSLRIRKNTSKFLLPSNIISSVRLKKLS